MNDIKERYEERAAIMHFCGGIPKEKAEALAKAECDSYLNEWAKRRDELAGHG